jgi:hypothetical protein
MLNKPIILAALLFLGGVIIGAMIPNRWEIRVANRGIVWRLDRLTGHLEMCIPGQPPKCEAAEPTNPFDRFGPPDDWVAPAE